MEPTLPLLTPVKGLSRGSRPLALRGYPFMGSHGTGLRPEPALCTCLFYKGMYQCSMRLVWGASALWSLLTMIPICKSMIIGPHGDPSLPRQGRVSMGSPFRVPLSFAEGVTLQGNP